MIGLLPKWRCPDSSPAFYDIESVTAIEGVAKMCVKINELITDYNKFVDEWNAKISEFEYSTKEELELFEKSMRQEFQDFIDSVDIKCKLLEEEVKSVSLFKEDSSELESELKEDISELESELKESIENNIVIDDLKSRINILEGILLTFEEVQTSKVPLGVCEYVILNSIENNNLKTGGKIISLPPPSNNLLPKEEDKVHTLNEVESYSISLGHLKSGVNYYLKIKENGEGFGECSINGNSYLPDSPDGAEFSVVEDGDYSLEFVSQFVMGGENKINGTISEIMLCYASEEDKTYKPVEEDEIIDEYVIPEGFSYYGYTYFDFVEKILYNPSANTKKNMSDYVTYGEFLYLKVKPGGSIKYLNLGEENYSGTISYTVIKKA